MSGKSFTVLKMMNIPARFGLSPNVARMLRQLDDYHMGHISEDELGKMVRLSPQMRKSITETIAKCAGIMEKKPEEVKYCVAVIQNCTEILTAADKPPQMGSFNFLRLPSEIRRRVFKEVFKIHGMGFGALSQSKKAPCSCMDEREAAYISFKVPMNLAFTNKQMKDEVLDYVYQNRPFNFCCCCDLLHHLEKNSALAEKIRSIRVHWNGPRADAAFVKLANSPNLQSLTIAISKMTTMNLSGREKIIRQYFKTLRVPRLVDALGSNELFEIRGLREVKVVHITHRMTNRRSDEERCSLQHLLDSRLLKPRDAAIEPMS